jgi:hypothetical protein
MVDLVPVFYRGPHSEYNNPAGAGRLRGRGGSVAAGAGRMKGHHMKRFWLVPLLALAGLAASPSNASAHFFFRWCHPYGGYYGGGWAYPVPPQYYAVPQFYYLVPAPQYYSVPLNPPQVVPGDAAIPKAKTTGQPRSDAPPRSAPMVTVTPGMPSPVELDPAVKPAAGNNAVPVPAPAPMSPLTIPDPVVPKSPPKSDDLPPLTIPDPMVPKSPPKSDVPPPLTIPDPMVPKSPAKVTPEAKPMPAPASPDNVPAIPLPEPRKAPKGSDGKDDLPPLVLPPEGTGTSSGVIPTVSKSSPLGVAIKVQVFAAAGTATGTLRKVGFFNHTDRDLDLVIEGQSVKLPKKSYLNAQLPKKFTWKAAGNDANATTVPDGAAGVDVLFKD